MGRNKGDNNEFRDRRNEEIWKAYERILGIYGGKVSAMTIYSMVAFSPASRFFVTTEWAYRVVKNFARNKGNKASRVRMYNEIYNRVCAMREEHPEMSLPAIVDAVVRQPAPEMYLDPVEVMRVVKKEGKRRGEERIRKFRERQQRLAFCCTKIHS